MSSFFLVEFAFFDHWWLAVMGVGGGFLRTILIILVVGGDGLRSKNVLSPFDKVFLPVS